MSHPSKTQTVDIVWNILGEGEKKGVFFSGSTAEAVDDAIAITLMVLHNNIRTWGDYCAALKLDPKTGYEL